MIHWFFFSIVAVIKIFVISICFMSGQMLAILFGISQLIAFLIGGMNSVKKKSADDTITGVLVPVLYLISSFVLPTGTIDETEFIVGMGVLLFLQVFTYYHIGSSYSIGISTWTGKLAKEGPYSIVRHPLLAIDLLQRIVFVAGNITPWNIASTVILAVCIAGIIQIEEGYLCGFKRYRSYRDRVRFRLIPMVW